MNIHRLAVRLTVLSTAIAAGALMVAGPASAHVEVSADKSQAGATDVTVSFVAESESNTVGITSLRVVLPDGIAPGDVAWVSGPKGWSLTPGADGYTVAGPAVKAGADAEYAVKITKLPADATTLAFKTLQTYSDGRIDRWIELPQPGDGEPENAAPVLTLAAAAPAATPTATATGAPSPSAQASATSAATPAASEAAAPVSDEGGSSPWLWTTIAVIIVAALAAAAWLALRARQRVNTPTTGG